MEVTYEVMNETHRKGVMDKYNYYIENRVYPYPEEKDAYEFYDRFLHLTRDYPALAIMSGDGVIGFCFLKAYNPFSSFNGCAEITYFLANNYTGKGIGRQALVLLEDGAREKEIRHILANISSLNEPSLKFHLANGLIECGRFQGIISKKGDLL